MYPSTLVLPPGESQSFVLACIPKEPGELSILGEWYDCIMVEGLTFHCSIVAIVKLGMKMGLETIHCFVHAQCILYAPLLLPSIMV